MTKESTTQSYPWAPIQLDKSSIDNLKTFSLKKLVLQK